MKRFAFVFLCAIGLLLSPRILHATSYVIVGTCKPNYASYPTISQAVAAAPVGATVEVCPGTYAEQVTISTPLTLEGITIGNTNRAIIVPPSGGLSATVVSALGVSVAYQVLVTTGPVNITNITVDGTGNDGNGGSFLAGIFYEGGSSGTVNEVTARYQIDEGEGTGIWAENGTSTMETVTMENCDLHDIDYAGIFIASNQSSSTLAATIKGNTVAGESVGPSFGILSLGATGTVTGNVVSDFTSDGIADQLSSASLSISANTLTNTEANSYAAGIDLGGTGDSVKSNSVLNHNGSNTDGILIETASPPTIQDNKIANSNVAIEFSCYSATVSGNTITDAATALDQVPSSVASANIYYGASTIRTDCSSASSGAIAAKARLQALLKKLQLPLSR
jgi:hypothetical protein